jgi:hypothetical protein
VEIRPGFNTQQRCDRSTTTDLLKVLLSQFLNVLLGLLGVVWGSHGIEVMKDIMGVVPRDYNWRWLYPAGAGDEASTEASTDRLRVLQSGL